MPSVENTPSRRMPNRLLPTIPADGLAHAAAAAAIAADERVDGEFVGFTGRVFTQTCLPYRNPLLQNPGLRAWERRNGSMLLAVEPARIPRPDGTAEYRMPFGKYPRLILPWLTTQIVLRQSDREQDGTLPIEFSASLPKFLADLGQQWGGRKGQLLVEQVPALFGARISISQTARTGRGQGIRDAEYRLSDGYQLWWDNDGDLSGDGLWSNTVVLSARFVQDILDTPIPIDLRAVSLMAAYGPMAMDILTWMNYRLPAAKRTTLITWEQLHAQFGAQYNRLRDFKAQFVSKLPAVHTVYPAARFDVESIGLRVHPSPPAVARRALVGHPARRVQNASGR